MEQNNVKSESESSQSDAESIAYDEFEGDREDEVEFSVCEKSESDDEDESLTESDYENEYMTESQAEDELMGAADDEEEFVVEEKPIEEHAFVVKEEPFNEAEYNEYTNSVHKAKLLAESSDEDELMAFADSGIFEDEFVRKEKHIEEDGAVGKEEPVDVAESNVDKEPVEEEGFVGEEAAVVGKWTHEQLRPYDATIDGEELLAKLRSGEITEVTAMPPPRHTDLPKFPQFLGNIDEGGHLLWGASKEELMAWHKPRWQNIRKEWQRHVVRYNEERYGLNNAIYEELYKGQRF